MKTPEDEAFDDLARKQGAWGGGFMAKRAMAADKLQEDRIKYGTSWEKDGERIDPMSVYKEPVTEREALKQALEAYLCREMPAGTIIGDPKWWVPKIAAAIKEALAQPAQEPVAWVNTGELQGLTLGHYSHVEIYTDESAGRTPLYTTPPQPAQEPFGWYSAQEDEFMTHKIRKEHERLGSYTHINGKFDLPLYTTPPQREWVGLTDEEIDEGNKQSWVTKQAWESAVWWASEKLKEKNNGL